MYDYVKWTIPTDSAHRILEDISTYAAFEVSADEFRVNEFSSVLGCIVIMEGGHWLAYL